MWDWGSFTSGLAGAVLGALGCGLGILLFLRRSNRREGRLRAIENINAEARELSRVREDHPPEGAVALQPATMRQMSRATAAVSALSAGLSAKDAAVATWAMGRLVALVNAETPAQRFALVTVLNSTLAGWAAGRVDTSWFERENRAAEESVASGGAHSASAAHSATVAAATAEGPAAVGATSAGRRRGTARAS